MKVVLDPEAATELENQLDYLISRSSADAARRLEQRFFEFVYETLAAFPRMGAFVPGRSIWDTWFPDTRLLLWHRFKDDELQIVRVWHTSQDRRT